MNGAAPPLGQARRVGNLSGRQKTDRRLFGVENLFREAEAFGVLKGNDVQERARKRREVHAPEGLDPSGSGHAGGELPSVRAGEKIRELLGRAGEGVFEARFEISIGFTHLPRLEGLKGASSRVQGSAEGGQVPAAAALRDSASGPAAPEEIRTA